MTILEWVRAVAQAIAVGCYLMLALTTAVSGWYAGRWILVVVFAGSVLHVVNSWWSDWHARRCRRAAESWKWAATHPPARRRTGPLA